jgi:adenylosuccinate synthase
MDTLSAQGVNIGSENLLISSGAHLTLPSHISEDEIRECGAEAQGSTRSGIAPVYASKVLRKGVRAEIINNNLDGLFQIALNGLMAQRHLRTEAHLPNLDEEAIATEFTEAAKRLGEFVTDTSLFLNKELQRGAPILAEGAQAFLLDNDHGMYPYVTSSSTISGGVATGLGVPPKEIRRVIGISKAVQSHVGGGPFVTEISDPDILEKLHGSMSAVDAERGTTTGRTRRLGFLDLPAIKRSQMINGTDEMALTKLDWVPRFGKTIPVCVAYERKGKTLEIAPDAAYKLDQSTPVYQELANWDEDVSHARRYKDLPRTAKKYIDFIEEQTQTPITFIGVGPERDQVVIR